MMKIEHVDPASYAGVAIMEKHGEAFRCLVNECKLPPSVALATIINYRTERQSDFVKRVKREAVLAAVALPMLWALFAFKPWRALAALIP